MAILLSRQIKDESYDKCRWSRASNSVIACHFSSASFDNSQPGRQGGKRCGAKPAVDSRQPTSNFRVLPAYLRGCHGCQAGVCALLPLSPPEWLLIKNKHDFCFAFIFYYKPASPAPTRPALPCPAPAPSPFLPPWPARKAMSCNLQSFCSLTPAFTACYVCDCLCMYVFVYVCKLGKTSFFRCFIWVFCLACDKFLFACFR